MNRTESEAVDSPTSSRLGENVTNATAIQSLDHGVMLAQNVCRLVAVTLSLTTIWILLCTIVYGNKTKKWKRKANSNSLDRGNVYTCCVAAVALSLPRIVYNCVLLFIPAEMYATYCEAIMDGTNAAHFCAASPAYLFLWVRQKAIYSHPAVKGLGGKCATTLSWTVLITLSFMAAGIACLFIIPRSYDSSTNGCVVRSISSIGEHADTLHYVLAGFLIASQVSLLTLFIYPMMRSSLNQLRNQNHTASNATNLTHAGEGVPIRGKETQNFTQAMKRILCGAGEISENQNTSLARTIRRSVLATLVTLATDLSAMAVVTFLIPMTTPRTITNVVYDFSTLVNDLCILSTFGSRRKLLSVLCTRTENPQG